MSRVFTPIAALALLFAAGVAHAVLNAMTEITLASQPTYNG